MRILYTSDLHGKTWLYEELFQRAKSENVDCLIIGGDLLPAYRGNPVRGQREFLKEYLLNRLRTFNVSSPSTSIYLMMGNDDWKINMDLLEEANGSILHLLHLKKHAIGNAYLMGYGFVDVTPFGNKDWEKWDNSTRTSPYARLKGFVSTKSGLEETCFDPADRSDTIENDLERLARESDPAQTIYVMHAPPYHTKLDRTANGPVGSQAVRDFVTKYQPKLTLHGHVHESPHLTGHYGEQIGNTIAVNPGQGDQLHAVLFDAEDPAKTITHTIL